MANEYSCAQCEIPLTHGQVALVSADDHEALNRHKWRAAKSLNVNGHYAVRSVGGKLLYMHREILGAADGKMVDHINGNPLDNRRENLRFCSAAENSRNQKLCSRSKSGLKGACWCKTRHKWRSTISVGPKKVYLGLFDSATEAHAAYCAAAVRYFGQFARSA